MKEARLRHLINIWRHWAKLNASKIHRCEYADHTSRVILAQEIKSLRECARELKRALDKQ